MLPIISESKKDSRRRISTEIAPHFVVNAPVVRDISGRLKANSTCPCNRSRRRVQSGTGKEVCARWIHGNGMRSRAVYYCELCSDAR